ncbi:hypothetical protein SDC9_193672 [bioreactor metagenome]|uniref:Uncharacterized protein n=1 Tax=bioreactor metagenome TaxID=1076179 RepID=A0A645I5N5_9ZZZZ
MTDARYHRQGKLSTRSRQKIRIKARQIGCSPTSPNNNHHIELIYPGMNLIERLQNRVFNLIALHQGRKQLRIKIKAERVTL